MIPDEVFVLLFVWIVMIMVGAVIGQSARRNPVMGAVLGGLLGVIGWAAIFALEYAGPKCNACKSPIPDGATKCRHCGESQ